MKRTGFLSKDGPSGRVIFFVERSVVLGSSAQCEIPIPGAAPQHGRILLTDAGYEVQDLTGRNLVEVNGRRLSTSPLRDGDRITIGSESLIFAEARKIEPERRGPKSRPTRSAGEPRTVRRSHSRLLIVAAVGAALAAFLAVVLCFDGERTRQQTVLYPLGSVQAPRSPGR